MNAEIFKKWFHDHFVTKMEKYLKNKELKRNSILLLDNTPFHPDEEQLGRGEIRAYFLP